MAEITEYTRNIPPSAAGKLAKYGEPILALKDYDCVLCEREADAGFVYTAVNLTSGNAIMMSRRSTPLRTTEVTAMVARIRKSGIAGDNKRQADKPVNKNLPFRKAREILKAVFTKIMPQNGFAERAEQIDLANHILQTIETRGVTLAEAETGTGKTHSYLIPAIIAKRGRLNDHWNTSLYPKMQYADMSKMPIVIATSSIALQRALMTEYIPQLSKMLQDGEVIKEPLTAVLRKGKEHYICRKKLRAFLASVNDKDERERLETLLSDAFDLAEVEGLTPKIKQRICVSGKCYDNCPCAETCDYLKFRAEAADPTVDIQVCNHNYLLADTPNRAKGIPSLIPNYQMLVIDEAHKFIDAARSMYGSELSSDTVPRLYEKVLGRKYYRDNIALLAPETAEKLKSENRRLFNRLLQSAVYNDDDEATRYQVAIDADAARHLRNVRDISGRLIELLEDEAFYLKAEELLAWVNRKYGAKVSDIDLNRVITFVGGDLKYRVPAVHKVIRELPEIIERVALERANERNRVGYNPERRLYKKQKSKMMDVIWERTRLLFKQGNATARTASALQALSAR